MEEHKTHHRLFEIALWLTAFCLPWPIHVTSLSIVVLAMVWFLDRPPKERLANLKENAWVGLFAALYCTYLAGMLYTDDMLRGWFILEKMLPLLFVPLVLATSPPLSYAQGERVKIAFIVSCFIVSAVSIAYNLHDYFMPVHSPAANGLPLTPAQGPSAIWSMVSYIQLGKPMGLHPTYFSLYALLAILFLSETRFLSTPVRIPLMVYFSLVILMFSSRAGILVFAFAVAVMILRAFSRRHRRWAGVGVGLGFLFLVGIFTWINPVSRYRLWNEPFHTSLEIEPVNARWNSVNLRVLQWKGSLEIFARHWFLGAGTGDAESELTTYYQGYNIARPFQDYGAHNQYLQTASEVGLLGLAALVACLVVPFVNALRQKRVILLLFIFSFSVLCLTESMLQRQKGIVCLAFFAPMLLITRTPE